MKRCRCLLACLIAVHFNLLPGRAQDSLDALEKDLDDVKQQHQQTTTENFNNFVDALNTAAASPDAAVRLYLQAGGQAPPPTPVKTAYEHETPDEKAARLAQDRQTLSEFGTMLQLHCGLMRLAALYVDQPDLGTLHDDWIAWLKSASQLYPQLDGPSNIKYLKLDDSPIAAYYRFDDWKDKEQGKWSVKDVPRLYRRDVLDPLRNPPTAAALPAWDAYIAMENADESDPNKWNQIDYPALLFQRDSDDFNAAPSTDKLATLIDIIKKNTGHPKIDQWIATAHDMMKTYRDEHGATASTAPGPSTPADFVQPDNPNTPPAVAQPMTNAAPAK